MESTAVLSDAPTERVRRLYESDHTRLWRSLFAFSGSRDVADEATAEAFAQLLRRGDEVIDPAAWLWRSAFAIARGELKRRRSRDGILALESGRDDVADGLGDVLARLGGLSPDDRELIVLCHVAGWKPGELAPLLDVPAATLRVRLHRATNRARTLLEDQR
jgi:RNA polymerase sigma-70 factor (ECF subfamily)